MVFSYIKTHKTAINRLQTCTEGATKYYNYTVNETDEERNTDCPDCRPFQKRRDWIRPRIRQRLKFTVKIIFFDAAIGSKNYARQEYLSNGVGTADQPFHHDQHWGFTVTFILQWTVVMCDMFTAKRYICKKNPCWTTFSFTIFITFTSPKPSQVKYYCWPPIFAPIEFRISSQY